MANPFAAAAAWSARHPAIAITTTLLVAAALGAGISQAEPGRMNELFAPDDLPALTTMREIEEIWGASEGAFVLYITDDPTDPQLLRDVAADMQRFTELDGVQSATGLPTLIEKQHGTLSGDTRPIADAIAPRAPQFVADDALLVRIAMDPVTDIPGAVAALEYVRDQSNADAEILVAGPMFVEALQTEEAGGDVGFLMPLSLATVIALLGILFRRVQDVAVPLATVLLAIIMAYGTVAWAGLPLAPPSFIVMPLLLGLGIDYMLHIVYAYREADATQPVPKRFKEAAGHVGYPVFFTAATTLIGFGSFLASNVPQIRTWGLLIGSGALYAFVLGFFTMPALYRLRRKQRPRALPLDGALDALTRFVLGHRAAVLASALVVTAGLAVAALSVDVVDEVEMDVDPSAQPFRDLDEVQSRFGGQSVATLLIQPGAFNDVKDLEAALRASPHLGVLDGPALRMAQSPAPFEEATRGVATDDAWRVLVGYDAQQSAPAIAAIDDAVAASPLQIRVTGEDVLREESQSVFLGNLVRSTAIALVLVVLLLAAVFRQPMLAALAFLPLAVTVVWQLGIQSLIGIPINPITGVMTAMIMGVGVDYSLHIMAHFKREWHQGSQAAAAAAMRSVGRPVLAATITTVFAFSVLGASSLLPLRHFGIVAAIVVACAFIVSLTVLPVLASYLPSPAGAHAAPAPVRAKQGPMRIRPPSVRPRFADPALEDAFRNRS